jgi:hypothetical protein
VTNLAITPAMKPMMMVEIMLMNICPFRAAQ